MNLISAVLANTYGDANGGTNTQSCEETVNQYGSTMSYFW